tara:strand:+ start:339 stop:659 length:321 start_codon:yes stop_codon:yes gene_type:complete
MQITTVNRAHHITLSYCGGGKHIATWQGYDRNTVRRTVQAGNWHDTDGVALEAAELFVDWLNRGADENAPCRTYSHVIKSITVSYMKTDKNAIAVQTDTVAKAEAA